MFEKRLIELFEEHNHLLKEQILIMASLDQDVQAATVLIGDLVTALTSAGSGVPAADQSALEAAIASGQAALAGASGATGPTGAS